MWFCVRQEAVGARDAKGGGGALLSSRVRQAQEGDQGGEHR